MIHAKLWNVISIKYYISLMSKSFIVFLKFHIKLRDPEFLKNN